MINKCHSNNCVNNTEYDNFLQNIQIIPQILEKQIDFYSYGAEPVFKKINVLDSIYPILIDKSKTL